MNRLLSAALLSLALLIAACGENENSRAFMDRLKNQNQPGQKAVVFNARTTKDTFMSLADYRGKVVLLTFWRKKCRECPAYLDGIEKLYQKFKGDDFIVLAVNGDNIDYVPSSKIREFVDERGYSFPVIIDDQFAITEKYKIINIPASFLIDREGIISYAKDGDDDWMSDANVQRVKQLL